MAKEGDDIEALCEDMNVEKALEGLKTVDKGVRCSELNVHVRIFTMDIHTEGCHAPTIKHTVCGLVQYTFPVMHSKSL